MPSSTTSSDLARVLLVDDNEAMLARAAAARGQSTAGRYPLGRLARRARLSLRQVPGASPMNFLNVRLNAASDW